MRHLKFIYCNWNCLFILLVLKFLCLYLHIGVGIGQARSGFDRPEPGLRNKSQA
ncbi:transmembrane protein, putative [Medicago truncatula]|uniref:Transmembrane protein, putative n=1 Tax=Medicago truncatula TaxID=3880 RepID=G7KIS6_MEDTR|nr:transmembrane protein, putative [Medicago truncatula]